MNKQVEHPELPPGAFEKQIGAFLDDAMPKIVEAGLQVQRQFDAAGRAQASTRFPIERNKAVRDAVREATGELARLVFAARGHDGIALVREGAGRLVANTLEYYASVSLFPHGPTDRPFFDGLTAKFSAQLQQDVESLVEDFKHGRAWGKPFPSPSPSPTVVNAGDNNRSVRRVAGGTNITPSTSAKDAVNQIVREIDAILRLPQVALLSDADRHGLAETLDDIRDEAANEKPDPLRLRRWTERFLGRLKAAGVTVADDALKASLVAALTALGAPTSAL